jgi:hypothetical protein
MKYLIYLLAFINCIYAQQPTYFNILPDIGALENKAIFYGIVSDQYNIFTIGNRLTARDSNRQSIVDIQLNQFDYNGTLVTSCILKDSMIFNPSIGENRPMIKLNDSIYFYLLRVNEFPNTWSDFESILININQNKIISHRFIPRPFPGNYDFDNFINSYFVNGKLNLIFGTYFNFKKSHYLYIFNADLSIDKIKKLPEFKEYTTIFWLSHDSPNSYEIVGDSRTFKTNSELSEQGNLVYLKLDSNLNILKRIDFKGNFNINIGTGENFSIIRNEDKSFIISAYDWVNNSVGFYGKPITLKFSPEFDTLIWKRYMYQKFDNPEKLRFWINYTDKMKDKSGYVTCGDQFDQRTDSTSNYGIIYKVSDQGDSLWLKKYLPLFWDSKRCFGVRLYQVKVSEKNSIIACGLAGDREQQGTRAWLLHLDSDGCLVPGCNEVVNTKDINSESGKDFKIYPNPVVSNNLSIVCLGNNNKEINLQLLSLSGQILKETKFKSEQGLQIQLDIPFDISDGEYVLRFNSGTDIETKKLIVQRKK